jgi:hypothetical protein
MHAFDSLKAYRLWLRPAPSAFTSLREVILRRNAAENFVFIGCAAA